MPCGCQSFLACEDNQKTEGITDLTLWCMLLSVCCSEGDATNRYRLVCHLIYFNILTTRTLGLTFNFFIFCVGHLLVLLFSHRVNCWKPSATIRFASIMWSHAKCNIFALCVPLHLVRTTGVNLWRFYLVTTTEDCLACVSIISPCLGAWSWSYTHSTPKDVNDNWASHSGSLPVGK